jgi:hypothetical protein
MSDATEQLRASLDRVRVSLAIEAPNHSMLLAWAIKHLEEHGYSVRPPNERWENVTNYCRRLHIHTETLRRAAEHPQRPNVVIHRGPSGRILELLTNADFDAFVLRHKNRPKIDRRDHATRMRSRRSQ